jgi:hypothetical protein
LLKRLNPPSSCKTDERLLAGWLDPLAPPSILEMLTVSAPEVRSIRNAETAITITANGAHDASKGA